MNSDSIALLERRLNLKCPAPYRSTMLAYPFPSDSSAAELWLLDDLDRLLQLNSRPLRPNRFLAVGTDGGEFTYVLDTIPPFAVLALNAETGKLEPYSPDFDSFVRELHHGLAEIDADERAMTEAYMSKKWWQFWIRPYPRRRAT